MWGLKLALFTKKTCNKKVVVMAEGGHEVDRWLIHGVESFKVLFVLHLPCRLFVLFSTLEKLESHKKSTKKRIIMAEQQTKVPDKSATTQVNAARHHS